MQIIKIPVEKLTPYAKNAKKHTEKQIDHIVNSINRFGFNNPIGIWGESDVVVTGHGRLMAVKKMGWSEVDCIRLDHMTDEERRAYTLADNETSMQTDWDGKTLKDELSELDFDMGEFGFDLGDIFKEKPPAGYKQTKNLGNLFKTDFDLTGNEWGIPETEPFTCDLTGVEWVSFGEKAKITDFSNVGIHFYIDDYKFESVWTTPDKWLEIFQQCRAVATPDFSNYTDMPKAQQLWNHYRRQWCGRYWQDRGVNVINSLSWANGQIAEWCFAGIPKGATVTTSFVGDNIDKQASIDELRRVLDAVEPCRVYIKANSEDAALLQSCIDFELIPPFTFRGK